MEKKYLKTRASRKRFVVWATIAVSLLALTAIVSVAFSDEKSFFSENGELNLSSSLLISVARIITFVVMFLVGVAAIIVIAFVFVFVIFFFTADPTYKVTLRAKVRWYDNMWDKLEDDIFPAVVRFISWPFYKTSVTIRGWINSGVE